jgi:hypothetical protein
MLAGVLAIGASFGATGSSAAAGDRPACCLYWAGGGTIGRAQFGGPYGQRDFIRPSGGATGIAVDDDHVYWTASAPSVLNSIGRADLDGGGIDATLIGGPTRSPAAVAVKGAHIYWSEPLNDSIGRANLDGSGVEQGFISTFAPGALAVDAGHLYWASVAGDIGRAALDGSDYEPQFVTGANCPAGLAVNGTYLFWTNFCGDSIGRAALDRSSVTQSLLPASDPWGLVADDAGIFWSQLDTGAIGHADLDGHVVDEDVVRDAGAVQLAIGPPGPIGSVSANRRQAQTKHRIRVEVEASAQQRLSARATGTVKLNTGKRSRFGLIKTPRFSGHAVRDRTKALFLKPKKRGDERRILRALDRGLGATAEINVRISDVIGNSERYVVRTRLTARRR